MFETSTHFSHLKFLVVAGVGLFGDGYLNLSIGLGALKPQFPPFPQAFFLYVILTPIGS